MRLRAYLCCFIARLKAFGRSEAGMTLPLLAISMVAITSMVGIAIDTGRAQLVQSKLQFSLDAAGLAAGSTVSTANLQTEVAKYLNVNFNGYLGSTLTGSSVTADSTNTVLTLSATATLPSTFMGVVGVKTINVSANSQITRAVTGLELVLVLDNTGSMTNSAGQGISKIQALKSAATALVTTLFGSGNTGDKLWVGVVPFSQGVNIGTGHADWMDTAYDNTLNWGPTSWYGCVDARANGEDITDDPPTGGNTNTLFRQYYWPTDSNNCWETTKVSGNRVCSSAGTSPKYSSPLDETNQGPNLLCPQQVTLMTNDKQTVLDAINSMTAQGDTLINQGLQWGWNMISPRWRGKWGGTMAANNLPLDYNTHGMNKVIVVLTDGVNTVDNSAHGAYWYLSDKKLGTTNSGTAVTTLNNRTQSICTALKNNGVYVYTIALGTDTTSASLALLQNCATAQNYYFDSPSTSQLQSVFSAIGDSLSNLRVSQ